MQTDSLIVAVGSTRNPKLGAVRDALDTLGHLLDPDKSFEVIGMEVDSGVSHTPCGREELMKGARQRAEALARVAVEKPEPWDFFVGLEGGLDAVADQGRRRIFLESWAYVSDGAQGFFGRSPGVEIPQALVEEVLVRGTELSVAIDRFAGEVGVRDARGAWGVLSANLISRQDAFRMAVIAAFAPFYNSSMYRQAAAAG